MSTEIVGIVEDRMPSVVPANPFERMAIALVDKGGDLAKLDQLLELQMKWDREQARKAYDNAMAECQAAMPRVYKDKYNEQTKSWYATLESVAKAAQPIYTAHGFSLSFNTSESKYANHILIKCKCSHKDGHSEHFEYDQPLDDAGIAGNKNKTPTHARGSAVSYGRRYLTMMVFNLATSDDDDGNKATEKREAPPSAEDKLAKKVAAFAEAHGRLSESVTYIKDRIAADDIKPAAEEWYQFSQDDQMALFLAESKGGCFTATERTVMKNKFGQFNPNRQEAT